MSRLREFFDKSYVNEKVNVFYFPPNPFKKLTFEVVTAGRKPVPKKNVSKLVSKRP